MIKHTIQCGKCSEWGYCRSKYSQEGCLAKMMFHKDQKRIANLMCRRDSLREELAEAKTEIIKATADVLLYDKKREQAEKALAEAYESIRWRQETLQEANKCIDAMQKVLAEKDKEIARIICSTCQTEIILDYPAEEKK